MQARSDLGRKESSERTGVVRRGLRLLLVGQGDHWLLIGVEPPRTPAGSMRCGRRWSRAGRDEPSADRHRRCSLRQRGTARWSSSTPLRARSHRCPPAGGWCRSTGDAGFFHFFFQCRLCEANGGLRRRSGVAVVPAALAEIRPRSRSRRPRDRDSRDPRHHRRHSAGDPGGVELRSAAHRLPAADVHRPDPPIEPPTRVVPPQPAEPPASTAPAATMLPCSTPPPSPAPSGTSLDHDGSTVGHQIPVAEPTTEDDGHTTHRAYAAPAAEDHDGMTTHLVAPAEDIDHDGMTTYRPEGQASEEPGEVDHLSHNTRETVLAVHCPRGHVTPAYTPTCRTCNAPVPPQEPQRLPRPRPGGLILPTPADAPLNRGVVFGRKPARDAGRGGVAAPGFPTSPQDSSYLSRMHLADRARRLAGDGAGPRRSRRYDAQGAGPRCRRSCEPVRHTCWESGMLWTWQTCTKSCSR